MAWLDEIEADIAYYEAHIDSLRAGSEISLGQKRRMARVIREQQALIKLLEQKYNNALVLHHVHGMGTVDAELKEAYDNLSDDAKELLG